MADELQVQRAKKVRSAQLQQVQKQLQAQQRRVRGLRATTLRVPLQPGGAAGPAGKGSTFSV